MASKIKEAFMGEKGLSGQVKKLPLEKLYELSTVKQVGSTFFHASSMHAVHGASVLALTSRSLQGSNWDSVPTPMLQICRTSDGYQPHLVSPEAGMRQLATETMDQVADPVHACVQQVYLLLVNAARCVGLTTMLQFWLRWLQQALGAACRCCGCVLLPYAP